MLDPAAAFANALGYGSIACWLCAQLPQVIKNWELKSCDGLALPFLITWLFGDLTNLIGCILTDQLPFQTYLATYFCLVDITLVAQFFYYKPAQPHHTPGRPLSSPRAAALARLSAPNSPHVHAHGAHTLPTPHGHAPLSRPPSGRGRRRNPQYAQGLTDSPVALVAPDSVEALYAAALDVARAAERVSRRSGPGRPRAPRHAATAPPGDDMIESFHSELSLPSCMSSEDDLARHRMTQSMGALSAHGLDRGRTLTRTSTIQTPPNERGDTVDALPDTGVIEVRRSARSQSRSQSAARTRGSGRRAAGVAFMSLGLLFMRAAPHLPGVGTGHGAHSGGHVIHRDGHGPQLVPFTPPTSPPYEHVPSWQPAYLHPALLPHHSVIVDQPVFSNDDPASGRPPPGGHKPEPEINLQEIIGRISAWCCTTLYLTSRLPQIWKNFQRKSVEGLSLFLFLFAFLGNLLYVFSIVLAPTPPGQRRHYLFRALPYLLGSGGTLMFDATIMTQAFLYGSAPPVPVPTLERPRRSYSYGAFRRRSRHPEDGLSVSVASLPPERVPLLASPAASPMRGGTSACPAHARRPTPTRTSSDGSVGRRSSGGLGVRLYGDESPAKSGSSPTKQV